ncbi:sulfurtransferase TusA family protein [Halorussus salinisoli]|uniref:sulfurtransferase TusA family protein n=1 Tax=Halorussus salinisoli TaxID=2558242 RepID=UPI002A912BD3|nr:sulfurtransferase TusA family protein [Halorussus salinisoli]
MKIDVSGLVCPQPVLVVRRCLEELDSGDELVVVGDYPPAERSIRRTCYKHGYDVSDGPPPDAEDEFSLRIRVSESASLTGESAVSGIE